ncbi:unnamed protein product [Peniophora sp. CBMAI 1063]|nr:unnamed protein product [Peniophora sp. CBMAI 1063]
MEFLRKLRIPVPKRRPGQPAPQETYTFHPSDATGNGTTYVLNSVVKNRKGAARYTVATMARETTIADKKGTVFARIEWNHARYPRIKYRDSKAMKCKKWFKYGVSRLTRIVRANGNSYRWARVDREDVFTFTREEKDKSVPPVCIAGEDDNGRLVAYFFGETKSTGAVLVQDALIVALVLLHGKKGWLKLGQFGPNPEIYMKKSLAVTLALVGVGKAIKQVVP